MAHVKLEKNIMLTQCRHIMRPSYSSTYLFCISACETRAGSRRRGRAVRKHWRETCVNSGSSWRPMTFICDLFSCKLAHRSVLPRERSHHFGFVCLIAFELGARTGQTDRRTDGQDP